MIPLIARCVVHNEIRKSQTGMLDLSIVQCTIDVRVEKVFAWIFFFPPFADVFELHIPLWGPWWSG